ncbi:MAG: DUF3857 domain-containing protein [Marinilabiliaceae bacterium]|nr:DUF3857 domain-containing protein [Marinilabiliaceae bacterium]
MKHPILFLLSCLFSISAIHGQETFEFGLLNPWELELEQCAYEKDAPAVVLFDRGDARFIQTDEGFVIRFERHTRIKIFNEAGFDQAEVEIPLYKGENDLESIREIQGFTYNFEGGVEKTPLDKKQVYKDEINKYWFSKKFAMPKIKAGSIIEYKYVIDSPFLLFFRDWEFQTDVPVLYSEYKIGMIPFFSYRYKVQGVTSLTKFNSYDKKGIGHTYRGIDYNEKIYEFALKNVRSFQDESFISSRNDYIKKVDFQLAEYISPTGYTQKIMETWPKLAKELMDDEDFGRYIKKACRKGEKDFPNRATLPENKRVNEVLNHVKKNYKWNNRHGIVASEEMKAFEKNKTGNSANLNLLALGLLQGAGIKAEPIIISTRKHGKVASNFPFLDQFNYVLILAETDGKKRLLDATDPFYSNLLIPSKCINGKGFIINEDTEQWVNIANYTPSISETYLHYSVSPGEAKLSGDCRIKYKGFKAVRERMDFYSDKEAYSDYYTNKNLELTNEIEVKHLHDNDQPFTCSFSFDHAVDVIDDQIIISPFLSLPPRENWFKQEQRSLPIDLIYPQASRYTTIIELPEGYTVDVLPEKSKMKTDNVEFSYAVMALGDDKLQLASTFNFRKPTYQASDYAELKRFMNLVTRKLNEKIVLIKRGEIAFQ